MSDHSLSAKNKIMTRRALLGLAAGACLSAAGVTVGTLALIGAAPGDAQAQRAAASPTVPVEDLMKPGQLPDLVYGQSDAKITIVEYASMTCPHCASFHTNVLPKLKEKYIDTGKVKLVFREFPLNNLAAGASMLARCAGAGAGGKSLKMIDILFKTQPKWAFERSNPLPPLFNIAKQFGFKQAEFDTCLKDQKLLSALTSSRTRASRSFGVTSTPHFFVNGKRLKGSSMAIFDKAIKPLL